MSAFSGKGVHNPGELGEGSRLACWACPARVVQMESQVELVLGSFEYIFYLSRIPRAPQCAL